MRNIDGKAIADDLLAEIARLGSGKLTERMGAFHSLRCLFHRMGG